MSLNLTIVFTDQLSPDSTDPQDQMDDHCSYRSKRKLIQIACSACGNILYEPDSKRRRILPDEDDESDYYYSSVFTMGSGDTGELGLGPDETEIARPTLVTNLPMDIKQIAAGGLHSVCLTDNGMVYTFGMNDQGTLGRRTEEEEHCFLPGTVGLFARVVQVSAGDSHTAALTYDGSLFIWGTFRDSEGNSSLIHKGPEKSFRPVQVMPDITVIKVTSGTDHIVCLTEDRHIYSFGNNEQCQLGRPSQQFIDEDSPRYASLLLIPERVEFPRPSLQFKNVWTGYYASFAKSESGEIYAWGLNNYYQLGFGDMDPRLSPERWTQMPEDGEWMEIAVGSHHTLARDDSGRVYSVGRGDYGQLGIGRIPSGSEQLSRTIGSIPKLRKIECVSIACGASVSFAVTRNGTVYGWGMGSEQLGLGDLEFRNVYVPTPIGGELRTREVLSVACGGQHTIILTDEPMSKPWCDVEGHISRF